MPVVRISLLRGKSPEYLQALSENVHRALTDSFDVPADDRFQVIHQHDPGELILDRSYLGGPRSNDYVLIAITAGKVRSTEVKKTFYRRVVELLGQSPGVRPEDIMIIITTNSPDEWSFSRGEASMIEAPSYVPALGGQ
jgi:phenylpyruvate tautomerase PptA (4-oxalocrotonate tautomerase family)